MSKLLCQSCHNRPATDVYKVFCDTCLDRIQEMVANVTSREKSGLDSTAKSGLDAARRCTDCLQPVRNSEDVYGQLCQRCYDNLRHMRNGTKTREQVRLELLESAQAEVVRLREAKEELRAVLIETQQAHLASIEEIVRLQKELDAAEAFYKVTVKERDYEREVNTRLRVAICEWAAADETDRRQDGDAWERLFVAEAALREIAREGR